MSLPFHLPDFLFCFIYLLFYYADVFFFSAWTPFVHSFFHSFIRPAVRSLDLSIIQPGMHDVQREAESSKEHGARRCCVSSGSFPIFCRHSPCLVHLESVNNTLFAERVSYSSILAIEIKLGRSHQPKNSCKIKSWNVVVLSSHKAFCRDITV